MEKMDFKIFSTANQESAYLDVSGCVYEKESDHRGKCETFIYKFDRGDTDNI